MKGNYNGRSQREQEGLYKLRKKRRIEENELRDAFGFREHE